MNEEQATKYVRELLRLMVSRKGSDLFLADDFPPSIKIDGKITGVAQQKLTAVQTRALAYAIMGEKPRAEFERDKECNFAISPEGIGRFRANVFMQQDCVSAVLRTIPTEVPTIEKMGLPERLKEIAMSRRGLVLMAGGTGSGKSTSLAAMINHRNATSADHIITIEDPIEFVHKNLKSLVSHREVGRDTLGWANALQNALRRRPTSSSSARSATARRWSTPSPSPRPATWRWRRCTPTTPTRPSTGSSTSSPRTSGHRCCWTSR